MKNPNYTAFDHFNVSAFYLAPLVLLAATVAKSLEETFSFKAGILGGVLTSFAFILFVFVVLQLTSYVYKKLPRFALVMRVLMVYTCFVGFTFGLDGVLLTATEGNYTFWTMAGAQIFLYSGLLWPISLIVMGAVCYIRKVLPPTLAGLLILSGILFPMGRIPGNEVLYYLSDIAFLITFFSIARFLRTAGTFTQERSPVLPLQEAL